ncbi:MAG: tripartite tricarboxylate transporter substrate binding protein [Polaromonas sp.]|jgi:tripartite-type tricarboxylate transporter receptor subunit TctC|nr:tripartite tricarboxylate transporter substrate binding protein [Polaromonas sp.]
MTRLFSPSSFVQTTVLLSLTALSMFSQAQTAGWPQKPIKIIVPFAAGGNTDSIARLTAERLTQSLGQTVVVENKAGAGGAIAADLVAKATPDGYTLLMAAMPVLAILPTITKTNFDPLRDFAPISIVGSNPFVMAIHKSVPAANAMELADFAKKNTRKLNYASGGSGSVSHLSAALFVKRANIDMTHISYKGGSPAVTDLLGGQVQMYFGNLSELAPHAAGGQIRIIGVSSAQRARQLPDVPTIAESGFPGFKTITWNGLVAPAGTPPAIINRIAAIVKDAVAQPDMIAKLGQMGVDPIGDTPAQFMDTLKADLSVWSEAAKASNLKME